MAADSPNVPTTRSRSLPSPGEFPSRLVYIWESTHPLDRNDPNNGKRVITTGKVRVSAFHGRQKTVSTSHPQWRSRLGSTIDVGGDFYTERSYVRVNNSFQKASRVRVIDQWRKQSSFYEGPILAANSNQLSAATNASFGFPLVSRSSDAELNAWGAKAIAATKPTNSLVDLSTTLGEIAFGGLPRIAGLALKKPGSPPKKLGDEYLNYEFGWKPLIGDTQAFARVVADIDRVYRQYLRDSGRIVRRRYDFPPEVTETRTRFATARRAITGGVNSDLLSAGPATGELWRVDRTTRRRWFSGAYTYHVPNLDKSGKIVHYASVARKLLGATIDPDTIWNLAPWSWAVDWFSSVGDVINNVTDMATDGLVLRWGYIMEHTLCERTLTHVGESGIYGDPPVADVTLVSEIKVRRRANPYGFGITWSSLSGRQQAILTALGMSKGR